MNNRHTLTPIFLATFSFTLALAHAEPGVPSENVSSNAAPALTAPVLPPNPPAVQPPVITSPSDTPATATGDRPATYTVVSGDSLWVIAEKFHCSVKELKKVNNLTKKNLKPGQVLKIPPAHSDKAATPKAPAKPSASTTAKPKAIASTTPKPSATASTTPKKTSSKTKDKTYVKAQPVQDFDIPASTFASCPPPPTASNDDAVADDTVIAQPKKSAPVAELVSPSEFSAAESKPKLLDTPAPRIAKSTAPVTPAPAPVAKPLPAPASAPTMASNAPHPSSTKQFNRNTAVSASEPIPATASNDWAGRFLAEARKLGDRGIDYAESWRPPGESSSWAMDCSNTSRYLYKTTTGLQLPRTASDQYYYLHLQGKAWDVPAGTTMEAEYNLLRSNLKAGDLLFWENTYKPERQPPITHVMVFLGTNEKGQWIMAGSQTSRGGEHNRRDGGPDIYIFDPAKPCGGYSTWMGLVRHKGRFCAYGRPLEADPTKLAVAANN